MADERRIVIELKLPNAENANSGTDNQEDENGELKDALQKMLHPIKTMEKTIFGKHILLMSAYNTAKNTIKNQTFYYAQKYFDLTENYIAQQNLSNTMTAISKVAGFGSSVLGGAISGAEGGVPGMVVGAIIGGSTWAINEGLTLFHTYQEQNRMINLDKMQSTFAMTRMGLIDGGRGTEN